MRNVSLYAIYGTACHTLYVGSTDFLRARLARHAWDLANQQHHAPGLARAYAAAQRSAKPLRVLGLDWDTDEGLVRSMEQVLLGVLPKLLPRWSVANDKRPTEDDLRRYDTGYFRKVLDRLAVTALPSLARMRPVVPSQITGDLDDFLRFTDDIRRARAASARKRARI